MRLGNGFCAPATEATTTEITASARSARGHVGIPPFPWTSFTTYVLAYPAFGLRRIVQPSAAAIVRPGCRYRGSWTSRRSTTTPGAAGPCDRTGANIRSADRSSTLDPIRSAARSITTGSTSRCATTARNAERLRGEPTGSTRSRAGLSSSHRPVVHVASPASGTSDTDISTRSSGPESQWRPGNTSAGRVEGIGTST